MSNTVMGCMWYLGKGSSLHMMDNRDIFNDLEEKDLQQNIEFRDDERYNATNIGTITFQRESGSPLILADVLYVLGLRKNLFSVVILEDRGYDVIFRKEKMFRRHIAMGQVKQIGVRVKNLYALKVRDSCKTLRRKAVVSDLVVERGKLSLSVQPQKQSQKAVEKPQLEKQRGDRVEASTQVETSRMGKFQSRWEEGVHVAIPPGERWGDVKI